MKGLDLFGGGAAGWSQDDALGVEIDDAACATRRARGLPTFQGDVSQIDPRSMERYFPDGVEYVCASAPCQGFSTAGKGYGRPDREHLIAAGRRRMLVSPQAMNDPRSALTLEPLRWTLALQPTWVAWEQVEAILDVWLVFAQVLAIDGYNTWAGIVNAADCGTAQTRKRAILLAHKDLPVGKPPTIFPRLAMRDVLDLDDEVAIRMGRARGTRRTIDEPAPTIMFGKSPSGVVWELEGGGERLITVDEAAALQGLESGLPWQGGVVASYRQVGDAIPPPMAKHLIDSMLTSELVG